MNLTEMFNQTVPGNAASLFQDKVLALSRPSAKIKISGEENSEFADCAVKKHCLSS